MSLKKNAAGEVIKRSAQVYTWEAESFQLLFNYGKIFFFHFLPNK